MILPDPKSEKIRSDRIGFGLVSDRICTSLITVDVIVYEEQKVTALVFASCRNVMLNRMQHYIKNTNERDRLYKVSS